MAIVDAYLATIQGNGMPNVYPIPAPSRYQPINVFGVEHLQRAGLDNNGNICCHLSILLCFHRMQLLPFLCNSRIVASGNVLNWPALILKKMLEALPSTQSFCPYNFLTSWNSENRVPALQMNDDLTILDSILDQIPFSSSASSKTQPSQVPNGKQTARNHGWDALSARSQFVKSVGPRDTTSTKTGIIE